MSEILPSESDSQLTFIERNGGKVLIRTSYQYTKLRETKRGLSKWRCINWRQKCKGELTISVSTISIKISVGSS